MKKDRDRLVDLLSPLLTGNSKEYHAFSIALESIESYIEIQREEAQAKVRVNLFDNIRNE